MPKYRVTTPTGETFDVNAPDGATQEDAFQYVSENHGVLRRDAYVKATQERAKGPAQTEQRTSLLQDVAHGFNEFVKPYDRNYAQIKGTLFGESQDEINRSTENANKTREKLLGIEDYKTKTPGMVGNITSGATNVLMHAPMKGAAMVTDFAATTAGSSMNTYQELRAQGVDQKTALKVAGILGASAGVSAAMPAAFSKAKNIGVAAGGAGGTNAGQNAITNYAVAEILRGAGYSDLAKRYEPSWEQAGVDTIVGAVGGAAGRVLHKQPEVKNTTPRVQELDAQQQAAKRAAAEGDAMARVSRNPREEYAQQHAYQQAQAENEQPMSPINPYRVADPEAAAREMSRPQDIPTRAPEQLGFGFEDPAFRNRTEHQGSFDFGNVREQDGPPVADTRRVDQMSLFDGESSSVLRSNNTGTQHTILGDHGEPVGAIGTQHTIDGKRVLWSSTDGPDALGLGHEAKAFNELAENVTRNGGVLRSERTLSPSAQRLYQALKARGYTIARSFGIKRDENGNLVADKSDYVFKVTRENDTSTMPPEQYQAGLFTDEQAPRQAPEGGWGRQPVPPDPYNPPTQNDSQTGSPLDFWPGKKSSTEIEDAIAAANRQANEQTGPFSLQKPKAPEAAKPAEPPKVEIQDPVTDKLVTGIVGEDRSLPGRNNQVDPNKAMGRNPLLKRDFDDWEKQDNPEIIKARVLDPEANDISPSRLKQQMAPGANVRQVLTNNPVIKFANTVWRQREVVQNSFLEKYITGSRDTIPFWGNKLSAKDLAEAMQAMKVADTNGMEITPEQLATFTPNQQGFIKAWKAAFDAAYLAHNQSNLANGLNTFEARAGYFPSVADNSYLTVVRDSNGRVVQLLGAETRKQLNKLIAQHKAQNPDHVIGDIEGTSLQGSSTGFKSLQMQKKLLDLLADKDPEFAKIVENYYATSESLRNHGLFGQDLHELKKTGVRGFAGDKYWLSPEENAKEMYQAGLRHLEESIAFSTAQEAFAKMQKVTKDTDIAGKMPNAIEYAEKYSRSAVGLIDDNLVGKTGKLVNAGIDAAFTNSMADALGANSNRVLKGMSAVKTFATWHMMAFGNIAFTVAQLAQPFQTVTPLLQTIASRTGSSTVDWLGSASHGSMASVAGWIELWSGKKTPFMNDFDRQAFKYMRDSGTAIFSEMERVEQASQGKVRKGAENVIEFNMKVGELATRPAAFMMFANALKKMAGNQYTDKEIFGIADNMTRMAMIDYSKQEKAMVFKNLGPLGNFTGALQTYKFGNLGLQAYLAKQAKDRGEIKPMVLALAAQVAAGGVIGVWGFEEANDILAWMSEKFPKVFGDKPIYLKDLVLRNLPKILSMGAMSELFGGDISSKFSAANLAPDGWADISPHGKYVAQIADEVVTAMEGGMAADDINRVLFALAPQSVKGTAEWLFNSRGNATLKRNKSDHVMDNSYFRSQDEWDKRTGPMQLKSIDETIEKTREYIGTRKTKFQQDMQTNILNKVVKDYVNNRLSYYDYDRASKRYEKIGGIPGEFDKQFTAKVGPITGEGRNNVLLRSRLSDLQRLQGDPATVNTPKEVRRYQNYE